MDGVNLARSAAETLSIDVLEIPTRARNALINAGFDTVNQLTLTKESELHRIQGLGKKSIKELKDALGRQGFELASRSSVSSRQGFVATDVFVDEFVVVVRNAQDAIEKLVQLVRKMSAKS